jgi:Tfp pilus assembly protein PilF
MREKSLEAIKYFPEQPLPYALAGVSYLMYSDIQAAIPFFNKGVQLADDNVSLKAQFYAHLGDCYYESDSVYQAFEMYEKVLDLDPNNVYVLNNYAYFLSIRNLNLSKAEQMSSRAVSLNSDNSTFLDTYAWVLYKRENYSLAKYYMKLAIEKAESPSSVLYEHYGDILYRCGEPEEALIMWKKAMEIGGEITEELKQKIETGVLSK